MLTAYDYSTAKYIDEAGVDVILVGDSLAMTALGYDTTHSIGVEEMKIFTKAVAKGVEHAMVVADMPFLSYHIDIADAVKNCGEMIKIGANAVKIEGANEYIYDLIKRLVGSGIPVMGHIGLTPQRAAMLGGFKAQARTAEGAARLLEDALLLEKAGCFAIVLEAVPYAVAQCITQKLSIPTISCGAGKYCDGQVLVIHDILGLSDFTPRFVKKYANLGELAVQAVQEYIKEVEENTFPTQEHSFSINEQEWEQFKKSL